MSRITLIQLFTDSNKSSETKFTNMNNKIIDQSPPSTIDRWDKCDIKKRVSNFPGNLHAKELD